MEETRAVLTEPQDLDRSELEQVLADRANP